MGLDVYVGTLTRYFTFDWETAVQTLAREQNIPLEMRRPPPPPGAVSDPGEIRNGILAWKREFSGVMREQASADVDWSESPSEPYFTTKPGWEGHAALCLLAAYSLYPAAPRPSRVPDAWAQDRVFRAYLGDEPNNLAGLFRRKLGPPAEGPLFTHITNVEMWVPGEFSGTVEVGGLTVVPMIIGSTSELLQQLRLLNERTYQADAATMESWPREEPEDTFDQEARRGLAMFTELATKAVKHRLPMKLDY